MAATATIEVDGMDDATFDALKSDMMAGKDVRGADAAPVIEEEVIPADDAGDSDETTTTDDLPTETTSDASKPEKQEMVPHGRFHHERELRHALGHLPGITLYGAPTVNAYKRFEVGSFAPTTAVWGGDNRTVAVRALVEQPHSSRVELRTGGADANPYWAIASYLAAGLCGIVEGADPGPRSEGNVYGVGPALPTVLIDAIRSARADGAVRAILGEAASGDFSLLCESEWNAFITAVTDWDRDRYLHLA